ncbi:MAG: SRPBCC family protein [Ignavibacteriales bacterium]|nr:SRPBCC family protein [Ignavibacteriales bacterium]
MKIYQYKTSQKLNISKNDAWNFFSNPTNLSKITPNWLSFQVTSSLPEKMYAGLIISYTVKPLLNIPSTWVTEITHVNEQNYFVDEQRFGPYKMWHHEHIFKEADDGNILMEDIVSYAVPFGYLGRIVNSIIISKKINEIFEYRRIVLEKMFG